MPRIVVAEPDDLGPPVDPADPPVLVVNGQEFVCLADMPAGAIVRMYKAGSGTVGMALFLESCLADEADEERWLDAISDRGRLVSSAAIAAGFVQLAEHYAARPTLPPTPSRDGRSPNGTTSTVDAAETASASAT